MSRGIAEACTNHHVENVMPHIMLRLQAKQEYRQALLSVQKGDSQVGHKVEERRKTCWDKIIRDRIIIPANAIKIYDSQGNTTGRLVYSEESVMLEPLPVNQAVTHQFISSSAAVNHLDSTSELATNEAPDTHLAASLEPAACLEPAARLEPSTCLEPAARLEPSTRLEPAAHLEPSTRLEPAARLEPSTRLEPAARHESSTRLEPAAAAHFELAAHPEPIAHPEPDELVEEPPHHTYVHLTHENEKGKLKTSIGNLMAKVLGDDDNEMATFDRVRAAIKAAKGRKKNKEMLDHYKLLGICLKHR